MDPYTDDLVWARPGWSSQDARVAVRITLRNVLGNAHLFDSEVEELAYSISCVTLNANIKEFVRAIGLSHAYRSRFFESSSNTRFVENNFLHFLGRAPHNQQEISEHIAIINEQGYNAEINSYIDSDEYDVLFGESRIPAKNFRGGYPYDNDMNKLAVLSGGFSSSHRVVKTALLSDGDASNYSPLSILKGLPEAWCGENTARSNAGLAMEYDPDTFWVPKQLGIREAEVEWTSRYGVWTKFWYKDSAIYKSIMTPQLSHSYEEEEEAAAILKYGSNMAKSYCGVRKTFDIAPVIEITAPTNVDSNNGALRIQMEEISFSIPSELMQKV